MEKNDLCFGMKVTVRVKEFTDVIIDVTNDCVNFKEHGWYILDEIETMKGVKDD